MRTFLVIIDESEEATSALRYAARRAAAVGGAVHLLALVAQQNFSAFGAVQATAMGVSVALGGGLRDLVSTLVDSGVLGGALNSPVTGYGVVYHLEILLLFATLVAIGPLVRRDRGRQRLPAHPDRRRNDRRDVEVAVACRRRTNAHCVVGQPHMHGVGIGGRVHRDRLDPHFMRRAVDAQSDLAAIGDQDAFDAHDLRRSPPAAGRIRPAGRFRSGSR